MGVRSAPRRTAGIDPVVHSQQQKKTPLRKRGFFYYYCGGYSLAAVVKL
jgi:hypothetical protein